MKIQSIIIDELPKSCSECPLFSYKDSDISYCAGLSNFTKNEIEETPYLYMCRRSDCPLIIFKEIESKLKAISKFKEKIL